MSVISLLELSRVPSIITVSILLLACILDIFIIMYTYIEERSNEDAYHKQNSPALP